MTRKMEKGVRKEHRFDDLLALKATKTDLDLDTGALDGNPARKIRGLQTSCSGQRNARRGARSILDGERELDVRDGEALLVGRVGRQRGRRGEGERGGVFCCEKIRKRRIRSIGAPNFVARLRLTTRMFRTLSHHGNTRSTHARTSSKSSGWRAECVASTTFLVASATSNAAKPSLTTEQACL